jgi:hypothetical protein
MSLRASPRKEYPKELKQALFLKDIIAGAREIRVGDTAHQYLDRLGLAEQLAHVPRGRLLYHPRLNYWAGKQGTMPAIVAVADDGYQSSRAVQCTFLRADGSGLADVGAPRLYFGPMHGHYVSMCEREEGNPDASLLICFRFETALAVINRWHAQTDKLPRVWLAPSHTNLLRLTLDKAKYFQVSIVLEDTVKTDCAEIGKWFARLGIPSDYWQASTFLKVG